MISAYLNKNPCTWTSGPMYGEGYNSFFFFLPLSFKVASVNCNIISRQLNWFSAFQMFS